MENHYFDSLIAEVKPLLDGQGFKDFGEGVYKNDKKAVKIAYDETAKMDRLFMADNEEGEEEEYSEITSWLFDETQNAKDAASVGMDFSETIREKLGVKIKRETSAQIDMPTFTKDGAYNITAFTKKVLDVFPSLKEPYKDSVAKYGNFLYIDFFSRYLVPEIKTVYKENNKKSVKKVTEIFQSAYTSGDRDVVNILVGVLSAAVYDDAAAKDNLFAALGENTHCIAAITNFIPNIVKNKKLKEALVK